MFKKTSDAAKTCVVVFIDFSIFFLKKSMQHRAKNMENGYAHKTRQKIHVWSALFDQKNKLLSIFVPSGFPGASRDVPGGS